MLNIQMDHANKHRYIISDQKSCVLKIRDKTHCTWTMNDKNLNMPANATHLGIRRDTSSKFGVKLVVPDRIQTARKTISYSWYSTKNGSNMTSNFIFFIYFKKRVYENFICC
jgi:hypothetical protein